MDNDKKQSDTPEIALNAILDPAPITLGKLAILDKIRSPLLEPGFVRLSDAAPGVYLLQMSPAEALTHLDTLEADTLAWLDGLTSEEWKKKLAEVTDGLKSFFGLLPKSEDGAKKNCTQTDL